MQEVDEKIGIGVVSGAETLTKGGVRLLILEGRNTPDSLKDTVLQQLKDAGLAGETDKLENVNWFNDRVYEIAKSAYVEWENESIEAEMV